MANVYYIMKCMFIFFLAASIYIFLVLMCRSGMRAHRRYADDDIDYKYLFDRYPAEYLHYDNKPTLRVEAPSTSTPEPEVTDYVTEDFDTADDDKEFFFRDQPVGNILRDKKTRQMSYKQLEERLKQDIADESPDE